MNKLTVFVCVVLMFACKHEVLTVPGGNGGSAGGGSSTGGGTTPNQTTCSPDSVYFQQQVLPVLVSNCTMSGCHDVTSRQDGVILTSYESIIRTAEVRPGNPYESKLYRVLVATDPDKRMPRSPAAPLTSEQKTTIFNWIRQGAKNLSCQSACDATAPASFNNTVRPILSAKCTGCHGGAQPQAGIDLSSYAGVKRKIDDGRLWGAVNHLAGFSPMPKNGNKLSDCELQAIKKWMDAGALNN